VVRAITSASMIRRERSLSWRLTDARELFAERRFPVARGRAADEVRDIPSSERRLHQRRRSRAGGKQVSVGRAVGVQPDPLAGVRRGTMVQGEQAGGRLGQR
jgi:hypothetical protein